MRSTHRFSHSTRRPQDRHFRWGRSPWTPWWKFPASHIDSVLSQHGKGTAMLSKSKIFWCAATLMGGAVVFSSAALAETYRMRMHVNQPASEKSYHYVYATQFSERVAKYTDNAVKVTIFPGAQLGGDPAVFQQLQLGAVQSGIFAFPNLIEFYKPFNVFSLPFLFGDFDSAVTAFQGPTAQRLYDGFEKQVGVKVLGVFNEGFRGI